MAIPKFGSVIEFRTKKGYAYGIYTHKCIPYGCLIRFFDGFYQTRPEVLESLIQRGMRFSAFFPLGIALNRKLVEIAGYLDVPDELKPLPIFKKGFADPGTTTISQWWLWDGEREWRVGSLSAEQRKYPMTGTWNDTLIIERLEQGWNQEDV